MDHRLTPAEELRGPNGLWQYLIARSHWKARVEIERERSKAYAGHRDRLPGNAELMDYEDEQGRIFWIRNNESPGTRPGPQLPLTWVSQLRSAPIAEITLPADENPKGRTAP